MSKRYTKEFKQTILDLYNQGKNARQLSVEYDVGYSTVLKWVQGTKVPSPDGLTPDEAKLLKKQLKTQAEEIVILKKHSACWQRIKSN
ncbi:transposase [Enterococcus durans]|uniref:transposase n=1 Tax=Enterococcus durans TaxID=53345 RepID=UPI00242FAAD5|nr:transposase [Enterococcus durans]